MELRIFRTRKVAGLERGRGGGGSEMEFGHFEEEDIHINQVVLEISSFQLVQLGRECRLGWRGPGGRIRRRGDCLDLKVLMYSKIK
jgi:hypothetical protein